MPGKRKQPITQPNSHPPRPQTKTCRAAALRLSRAADRTAGMPSRPARGSAARPPCWSHQSAASAHPPAAHPCSSAPISCPAAYERVVRLHAQDLYCSPTVALQRKSRCKPNLADASKIILWRRHGNLTSWASGSRPAGRRRCSGRIRACGRGATRWRSGPAPRPRAGSRGAPSSGGCCARRPGEDHQSSGLDASTLAAALSEVGDQPRGFANYQLIFAVSVCTLKHTHPTCQQPTASGYQRQILLYCFIKAYTG